MLPSDSSFGISIPKIGANASVFANVDPMDKKEYERFLKKGVAHALGSALPEEPGNVFIFAHSTGTLWESRAYNAVFYLLNKLDPGDRIYLSFNQKIFVYQAVSQQIVQPTEVEYLRKGEGLKKLTLMTCWPLGLDLKRLIVKAEFIESYPL